MTKIFLERIKEMNETNKRKYAQTFTSVVDTFSLDKEKHCLIKTGCKDIQKEIDANYTCALDFMLDKYLNFNNDLDMSNVKDVPQVYDMPEFLELSDLGSSLEDIEEIRLRYSLPVEMTPNDILKFINEQKRQIKGKIESLEKEEKIDNGGNENA